ncbi:hypothetical protein GCM10012290_04790 [Halolactibacillus alkaliphilus]|uniref:1,4-beta-xylanase n=1 Tax=Halolactibacillus alkaliphilus TaxID=442899 RepID=A0A511WY49_9BACI|nr:1,4-beta-xylanase [Halolactibacillus alkaliphilus]GEN55887.1 hypothetical protein HAL01_03510 [Halolactibacillus alkaliphilus]GGN65756.1 hypothetical protein GCM10012290_04790 [Halolactibacillus alkaliphilus]SFO66181.1 hypothetical protein SAMN05720591_10365 [Halolactibacillus alkaliphilus]
MIFIKGFTFGWDSRRGDFLKQEAKESLRLMQMNTASDTVIIAISALQDTAHTTKVDYVGDHMVSDDELIAMIDYAKSLGLRVILKPTVNCKDGTWRAHINFFDVDVPCEPKWSDWFKSYTDYQLHYAKIAEVTDCEMVIVGCEMVQTERRADEWRQLILEVKQVYHGLVSYNTDKYQEDHVPFWDAVDVLSSSGYYPTGTWERELDRIETVVKKYNKPFFFAEAGCPSRTGSSYIPNDWNHVGEVNIKEQAAFYREMFEAAGQRDFVSGFGLWDWNTLLHTHEEAVTDDGYGVYGKPAADVIYNYYTREKRH